MKGVGREIANYKGFKVECCLQMNSRGCICDVKFWLRATHTGSASQYVKNVDTHVCKILTR